MELCGAALGLLGGAVLASEGALQGPGSDGPTKGTQQPQLTGDLAALTAAAAFVGYLSVGRKLRKWMPLFVYAAPVTGREAV